MTTSDTDPAYPLGSTDAEHDRLIRQAAQFAPFTERFFREAGIGRGQRILELGSGVGDVTMLVAQLVGSTGEVIGIERDRRSIELARARVVGAGLRNVSFVQSDVRAIAGNELFDAALGRFILAFLPDPVDVLISLSSRIRPGGVFAFQEPSYAPLLGYTAHLPLCSAAVSLIRDTLEATGVNTEMGPALYAVFQRAGLPAPSLRMEIPIGNDPEFTRWIFDVLCSLRGQALQPAYERLGDFATLHERLRAEVVTSNTVITSQGLVGVWSRKPAQSQS